MPYIILITLAVFISIIETVFARYIFFKIPESWLQDYGYESNLNEQKAIRMQSWSPILFFFALSLLANIPALVMSEILEKDLSVLHFLSIFLPLFPLMLIAQSDLLNHIIPDQFLFAAGLCSIPSFLLDASGKSLWFAYSPAHIQIFLRLGAGILSGLILFSLCWFFSKISTKEILGMGDIKLFSVCGFITGAYGIIFILLGTFICGCAASLVMLFQKHKEKRYIAYGPFLSISAIAFLLFEVPIYQFCQMHYLL